MHPPTETDRFVHIIVRVDDDGHLLQFLPRDCEADCGDPFIFGLDLSLEAALQLVGLVDDDVGILVLAVLGSDEDILGVVGLLALVLDPDRCDDDLAVGGFGTPIVLFALSATVPATSIISPSSNSATSSSVNCCSSATSPGVAAVASGAWEAAEFAPDAAAPVSGPLPPGVTPGCGWFADCTPHPAKTSKRPASGPESRLIDRHRTGPI